MLTEHYTKARDDYTTTTAEFPVQVPTFTLEFKKSNAPIPHQARMELEDKFCRQILSSKTELHTTCERWRLTYSK